MNRTPTRWIAALLGFFFPPLGMLYVAQATWAGVYLVALWVISVRFAGDHALPVAAKAAVLLGVSVGCAIHAYRFATRYPADTPLPRYSRWSGVLGRFLLGLLPLVLLVRTFVMEPYTIPSASMLPTLRPGSYLAVEKWGFGHYGVLGHGFSGGAAPLHRGDIIVFDYPEDPQIKFAKRVIGLPGDTVVYRDKELVIAGMKVPHVRQGVYTYQQPGAAPVSLARFGESLGEGGSYAVLVREDAPWIQMEPEAFPFRDQCAYDAHGLTCRVPEGQYFVLGDNRDNSRDSRYWGFVPADHVVGRAVYIW